MRYNKNGNFYTFNCCIRQDKECFEDPKELSRVLRELADRLEKYPDDHRGECRSSSGEYVGKWSNK